MWVHNPIASDAMKCGLHAGIPLVLTTFNHSESTAQRRRDVKQVLVESNFKRKRLDQVCVDAALGFYDDEEDARKWETFLSFNFP